MIWYDMIWYEITNTARRSRGLTAIAELLEFKWRDKSSPVKLVKICHVIQIQEAQLSRRAVLVISYHGPVSFAKYDIMPCNMEIVSRP